MKFTWNEQKRVNNMRKHGFDFGRVEEVFKGNEDTTEDRRFSYPERRFRTVGLLHGEVVVVIHTGDEEHIHVISLRKATRREASEFLRSLQ
ncbi:BrnT family toxin [Pseudoduganella sp.]|uniref:BrnT family toxin n=1 Tax=Pseudoduganella sp. TaxID=1880898 RepID=UPI0035B246C2